MSPHPFLGILLHSAGGLGAASFYVPFLRVRKWAWESYWVVGGIVFWVICPWLVALVTVPQLFEVLRTSASNSLLIACLLGLGWGVGNLTFGLSIRYMGFSLGYGATLGFCVLFGTLAPPVVKLASPDFMTNLAHQKPLNELWTSLSGQWTLAGLACAVVGIVLCAWAGVSKERDLSSAKLRESVPEFNLGIGLAVALLSGVMSSCVNFAITDTEPIALRAAALGTDPFWTNNVTMAVFLTAGATFNILWCLVLNVANGTAGDYVRTGDVPLVRNYLWCTLAGAIAYSEFFFYGVAAPQMGRFSFTNLPIHLAMVIVFSNIWGIAFAEWKGTSRRTKALIAGGIVVLVASTIMLGVGSFLEQQAGSPPAVLDVTQK